MVAYNPKFIECPKRVLDENALRKELDKILKPLYRDAYAEGYSFHKSCRRDEVAAVLTEIESSGLEATIRDFVLPDDGHTVPGYFAVFKRKAKSE